MTAVSKREVADVVLGPDLTLHCVFSGAGAIPIIFIPGWTMTSDVFERQLDHFAQSDRFRAISYDPRGQGQSSKPVDGYTYAQHGRDLAALIAALNLSKPILVGWSYGVLKMLAYINQSGYDHLLAAVVVDGAPRGLGKDPATDWAWRFPEDYVKDEFVLRVLENRRVASAEIARWCLETADPTELRWLEEISELTPSTIAAVTNETAIYANYEADLVSLSASLPVLIVVREEWRAIVEGWVAARAPRSRLAVMGKHMMFWDHAGEFNQLLDQFFKDI